MRLKKYIPNFCSGLEDKFYTINSREELLTSDLCIKWIHNGYTICYGDGYILGIKVNADDKKDYSIWFVVSVVTNESDKKTLSEWLPDWNKLREQYRKMLNDSKGLCKDCKFYCEELKMCCLPLCGKSGIEPEDEGCELFIRLREGEDREEIAKDFINRYVKGFYHTDKELFPTEQRVLGKVTLDELKKMEPRDIITEHEKTIEKNVVWNIDVSRMRMNDKDEKWKKSEIENMIRDGNKYRTVDDILLRAKICLKYCVYTDEEWNKYFIPAINKRFEQINKKKE